MKGGAQLPSPTLERVGHPKGVGHPRGMGHPAFLLIEVLLLVVIVAVAGLVTAVLIDGLYLQRTASARANRMATIDDLTRQLRRDALEAVSYDWSGAQLALQTVTPAGRAAVCYEIGSEAVVRTVHGAQTHVWRTQRLQFTARLEPGPAADVFFLDFIELPAPRARGLPKQRFALPLLLPPNPDGGHRRKRIGQSGVRRT